MKLLVQSLIFVSFLIPFLIGMEERFGASIFGPVFEIIKDQSRVDFYNKIALERMKSEYRKYHSNDTYKILTTSESYCDFEHYIKVDVRINKTEYETMEYVFVSHTGKKTGHGASFHLFIRSGKAESERYGKMALDLALAHPKEMKEIHGTEFKNPKILVLEADTEHGYKVYGVSFYTPSISNGQKEVPRAGFLIRQNGTFVGYDPYPMKKMREWCLSDLIHRNH